MTAPVHEFEGEQLTVAEIHERVPALSRDTIRKHLAKGRRTRTAMLSYNPDIDRREGAKRGGARTGMRHTINVDSTARRDMYQDKRTADSKVRGEHRRAAIKGSKNV